MVAKSRVDLATIFSCINLPLVHFLSYTTTLLDSFLKIIVIFLAKHLVYKINYFIFATDL